MLPAPWVLLLPPRRAGQEKEDVILHPWTALGACQGLGRTLACLVP